MIPDDEIIEWIDKEIKELTELEENEFFNEGLMNSYLGGIGALTRLKEFIYKDDNNQK